MSVVMEPQAFEAAKFAYKDLVSAVMDGCPCKICQGQARHAKMKYTPTGLAGLYARVLAEVNALRTEWGQEAIVQLPRGVMGRSADCPLRRALDLKVVSVSGHVVFREGFRIPATPTFRQFIHAFDTGQYPELIEPIEITVANELLILPAAS